MNKGELIDAVAASTGLSKADAGRAIDAMTSAVAGELASGGSCALPQSCQSRTQPCNW